MTWPLVLLLVLFGHCQGVDVHVTSSEVLLLLKLERQLLCNDVNEEVPQLLRQEFANLSRGLSDQTLAGMN
jgi:hypothetical protein